MSTLKSGLSPADLSKAIAGLVDCGATADAIVRQPAIMQLELVQDLATDGGGTARDDLYVASVAAQLLRNACNELEEQPESQSVPNRSRAALAALSLTPSLSSTPLKGNRGSPRGRLHEIARWTGFERDSLRSKRTDGSTVLGDLTDAVAATLWAAEIEFQVSSAQERRRALRSPQATALSVNWLGRFQAYHTMWNPLSGVHGELMRALKSRRTDASDFATSDAKSLYFFAKYLTALDRFTSGEFGGLWIFPDVRTEDAIVDTTWRIRSGSGLDEIEQSRLRMIYAQHRELAEFIDALDLEPHPAIMAKWRSWIDGCSCDDVADGAASCDVHQVLGWARCYMDGVDDQWDFVADWYAGPRSGSGIDDDEQLGGRSRRSVVANTENAAP